MNRLILMGALLGATVASADPSGNKWFLNACGSGCTMGTQCVNNKCVPLYRVAASVDNTGGQLLNGGIAYATVISRMQNAFSNWVASRVTACSTSWDVAYGGTFNSPSGTAAIVMNPNSVENNVIWLTGANWRYSSATLGLTTTNFFTAGNQIFDGDMELNNNVPWSDSGEAGKYDYESVVLHEAGHFLGLNHNNGATIAVMYPTVNPGAQKRVLTSPDTDDVCAVYPGAAGGQGYPCTMSAECTGGRVCEGLSTGGQKICTQDCSGTGQACPGNYACAASNAGFACLVIPGAPDLCHFCTNGQDCSTGICLTNGEGINWCSSTCSSNGQCGANYTCLMVSGAGYCVKNTPCNNQCTSPAQCAVGYGCTNGTCTPTGNAGDRCEVSQVCNNCTACVSDAVNTNIAYCRACCGGGSGNALCKTCSGTTCNGGYACLGLANGQDSVCIPSGGQTECAACNPGAPCVAGLQCVSGRCYSSCNPSNPGSCGACYDTGGGAGICGCQDQLAQAGDPCGPVAGGGIAACLTGQVCVGAPKVCRVLCNLNDSNSCLVGSACQLVDGAAVCVPQPPGGVCTDCANGGLCGAGLQCVDGRCYATCNVNASGACGGCVETGVGGNGVCACEDQRVGLGEVCGASPVAACQNGLACFNNTCRASCNAGNPTTCFSNQRCAAFHGGTYCLDDTGAGGGSATGGGSDTGGGPAGGGPAAGGNPFAGGSGFGGAGAGGGGAVDPVCGCTSGSAAGPWAVLALALFMRRRRA